MSSKARSEFSHLSQLDALGPEKSSPYLGNNPLARSPEVAAADQVIDWRTRDPETIQGEGIPVEELRFYCEKIDELLRDGEGKYVVIAGRQIIMYCTTLEAAVKVSRADFPGKRPLIKKVVATEPIHVLRGVLG